MQGLSLAAFSALGLLVVAKVMGPRVLLGTLALASPPAAQKVEWLLRTVRARTARARGAHAGAERALLTPRARVACARRARRRG